MSVNTLFRENFTTFKTQINQKLSTVSLNVESLLQIDVAQLPITKLLFQFIVAIVAVFATFAELMIYIGKNTYTTMFVPQ